MGTVRVSAVACMKHRRLLDSVMPSIDPLIANLAIATQVVVVPVLAIGVACSWSAVSDVIDTAERAGRAHEHERLNCKSHNAAQHCARVFSPRAVKGAAT